MSYEDMLRQSRALTRAFADPLDYTIYHYTSAEGFRGIVASGEIWLTNAAFVNDTTECKAFWECAKDLLEDVRLTNEYVREKLQLRLDDHRENDTYYIASFSKKKNLLQQYRAYGGFCIGFDPRKMPRKAWQLYKCVYETKDIKDWVCRKAKLRKWDGSCLEEDDKRSAAHNLVFAASMKLKSEAYREEQEMRLVAVSYHTWDQSEYLKALFPVSAPDIARRIHADDPPIYFRDHRAYGMPIPYVKFFTTARETTDGLSRQTQPETTSEMKRRKLKEEEGMPRELLPITEVWIGPMAHREEARHACEIMLREKGYEDVEVKIADIPYRGI